MDPAQGALGGAVCLQSSTDTGDRWGSVLELNEQTEEMVIGTAAYRCSHGGMAALRPGSPGEKTAFPWRWCVQQSPWGPACVCGTDLALSCPMAPWQLRALEAEHVSLGSALEVARWRQLALSGVLFKSCSRFMNMTPGRCD